MQFIALRTYASMYFSNVNNYKSELYDNITIKLRLIIRFIFKTFKININYYTKNILNEKYF